MRANCESCGKPQPPGWQPGDLCVHCGAAVRVDVRCFWCAKWTPQAPNGKFCRHCGAETVRADQYGAARMLKEAGTDRFTVPKLLRELDPDQIDNFTRIYQRQAVIVARHVDELRFLERFLFQTVFSPALDDALTPQLPWPDDTLARFSAGTPALPAGADLPTVQAIEANSPLPETRALALLARVKLEDWEAVKAARGVFQSAPQGSPLQTEAALTLSGWKVMTAIGPFLGARELLPALRLPALEKQFPFPVAERRARLGDDVDAGVLRDALTAPDPDTAFGAALALGDLDRLAVGLQGAPLQRAAAGRRRIELNALGGLSESLATSPPDIQLELLEGLRRTKTPLPELADALIDLYETTATDRLRVRAAEVLCRELNPDWAQRICAKAGKEIYIYQSLLSEKAALPPETVTEVARFMVENGRFRISQYGLPEAAKRGALPDTFVPAAFPTADDETQRELLRCAEEQLKARGDETLHRFVLNTVFGPFSGKTRAAAWWVLSRWYAQEKYAWKGPFKLRVAEVNRFFGSLAEFLPKFVAVLTDAPTMKEVGLYEFIADLLKYSETDLPAAFAADPALEAPGRALIEALLAVISSDFWSPLRGNAAWFLGVVGAHPAWRDEAIAGLRGRLDHESFDLRYACEHALKTLLGQPLD
ncbi:MAG: zinc ribbon domain-containing protein [Planctomycetota bacterium]